MAPEGSCEDVRLFFLTQYLGGSLTQAWKISDPCSVFQRKASGQIFSEKIYSVAPKYFPVALCKGLHLRPSFSLVSQWLTWSRTLISILASHGSLPAPDLLLRRAGRLPPCWASRFKGCVSQANLYSQSLLIRVTVSKAAVEGRSLVWVVGNHGGKCYASGAKMVLGTVLVVRRWVIELLCPDALIHLCRQSPQVSKVAQKLK